MSESQTRDVVAFIRTLSTAPKPAAKSAKPDLALGQSLYGKNGCGPCHGSKGKGDGSVAKSMKPKPTNFTDRKVMSKITDAQLAKAIRLGGKGVAKSAMMPAYRRTDERLGDQRAGALPQKPEVG